MGIDMTAVFQKREEDRWVDVSSNFVPNRNSAFYAWLGLDHMWIRPGSHLEIASLAKPRGYPEDFEIVNDFHPIANNSIRSPEHRERMRVVDENPKFHSHFTRLNIFLGDKCPSWLSAREVLSAPTPKQRLRVRMPVDVYRGWGGGTLPPGCIPLQTTDSGRVDIATPDEITPATGFVAVEGDCDLTEQNEFSEFIGELRRLSNLYGEVRVVFAFS